MNPSTIINRYTGDIVDTPFHLIDSNLLDFGIIMRCYSDRVFHRIQLRNNIHVADPKCLRLSKVYLDDGRYPLLTLTPIF